MRTKTRPTHDDHAPDAIDLISPREMAQRWRCSRSSVDRIARRAGFTRYVLGEGRNGMVRYLRGEVERFESSRKIHAR